MRRQDVVDQIRIIDERVSHLLDQRQMFVDMLAKWPEGVDEVEPEQSDELMDTWPGTNEARKRSSQKLKAVQLEMCEACDGIGVDCTVCGGRGVKEPSE